MPDNEASKTEYAKGAVGPLLIMGGFFADLWLNLFASEIQGTFWGKLLYRATSVGLIVVGLIFSVRLMPPIGLWFRTRILGFLGRDKVIEELTSDVQRLASNLKRQTKLIKLLNNLEEQILDLLLSSPVSKAARARQFKQLLRSVVEGAGNIMPREPEDDRRCIILVPKGARNRKKLKSLVWNVDTDSRHAERIEFDLNEGVAGKVFTEGRPHYCPNVDEDPCYVKHADSPYHYKTLFVCPIKSPTGETVGVLSLDNTRVNAYSEDDRERMLWLAKKLGVILFLSGLDPLSKEKGGSSDGE